MKKIKISDIGFSITEKLLDNANCKINFNPHNNFIDLDFLVFGKVSGKYFNIILKCDNIIEVKITYNDVDEQELRNTCDIFIILECKIYKKNINGKEIEEIILYGDIGIIIQCMKYNFEIYELNENEYKSKITK